MLPDSYFGRYDIYGKEVNVFSKVSAQFAGKIGKTSHQILVGADFKTDGNLGDGQVFDPMTPPHNSIVAVSNRPRKYKDIPFVSQLGVFAEENLAWSFAPGRKLYLQAGVRFDQIFDFKHAFSPRINLAVNILKDQALTLRGGWGILSKAPTVGYLYPDRAYFDFVNFNSMTRPDRPPKTNGWPWLPPEPSIQKTGTGSKSPRITKAKSESTASSEACSSR
ncbi:MAG: TonB-dependent receptor domain-containing protein [Alistipes indistinctus]